MALNSKTKIGSSGEQNDRMMRAGATGEQAIARAHSEKLAQERFNQQQTMQGAQLAGQTIGQAEDRQERQRQFDISAQQQQDRTDLDAAKSGFERQSKLEAEMQKGEGQGKIGALDSASQDRLKEQGKKSVEMDASGTWRPTEERKSNLERQNKREDFKADSDRIRAIAYRDQVGVTAQKALAAGDKEAYEGYAKQLARLPNDQQARYDRMMDGDVNSNDWGELKKLAAGGPEADPTLMADIEAKNFSPRVAQFMRAQVAKDALSSIVLSKGSTDYLKIDWTNPKMQEFAQTRANMNAFMASNPAMAQLAFIRSTEDKMRFLNVLAASQVLLGMSDAPSPTGGMTPATTAAQPMGQSPAAPMVDQTQGTARPGAPGPGVEAMQQGASPQERLQQGQQAQPTGQFGKPRSPGDTLDEYSGMF